MSFSKLDAEQTWRESFNDTNKAFRVFQVDGVVNAAWDYVGVVYATSVQEIYTFKSGGSGGTTVKTVTVNYTTSTKDFIDNVSVA